MKIPIPAELEEMLEESVQTQKEILKELKAIRKELRGSARQDGS